MEKKPVSPFRLMVGGKTWREWRKEFNVDRKPVFCAHPNIMASVTPYFNKCLVCAKEWDCCKEPPRVMIGYTEAGEDGGRSEINP